MIEIDVMFLLSLIIGFILLIVLIFCDKRK